MEPLGQFTNPGSIATASWLAEHRKDPTVVIVDTRCSVEIDSQGRFRTVPGHDGYVESHINADIYDTEGGTWAARLWWALRYHGHDKVRILDGGFTAWTAHNLPTEAVGSSDTIIVDALPEPFYTGQIPLYPHLRRGHIPGAANIPAPRNLDASTWELLAPQELAALWAPTLAGADSILTYCGGGVYGAFDLFVLHLLGHDAGLYDGSWEEWGALEDTPVETGPDTTTSASQ